MNDRTVDAWREDGFVLLPGFLDADDLADAVAALPRQFPTADEFHDDVDPARNARYRDEFAGIHGFPMEEVELNLLAVHPKIVELAADLLGRDPMGLRCSSAEAWAKYTGAADYDQPLHRDYLNHTQLVTTSDLRFQTVELFVYLVDVPEALGPPHFLSRRHTADLPAIPNWYPRRGGVQDDHGWVSLDDNRARYDLEVSGAGPAGTVAAYSPSTFHRGTAMTAPRGARYTVHVGFRPAEVEWGQQRSWMPQGNHPRWHAFVRRATWQQLVLFGWPPPSSPYWTDETRRGLALRYPGLDVSPWA